MYISFNIPKQKVNTIFATYVMIFANIRTTKFTIEEKIKEINKYQKA